MFQYDRVQFAEAEAVDVSIVMPCLNEVQCIAHCVGNAQAALSQLKALHGFSGEILIADNGSTDGSQALARSLGARVVPVPERGYGAALIGGCHAARGRFILMGDCDGSYDFTDGVAMIGRLVAGDAVCIGSRFAGGIAPGAMPWKNRWIGNPALTGILNLFFRSGIDDAHCGLRAIRKSSFLQLKLTGTGMEFASEMVIKAALLRLTIGQTPARLLPDLRSRKPHLRPWRDGWRHLRYLLMLAPNWLFGLPALAILLVAATIFTIAMFQMTGIVRRPLIGDYWLVLGGALAPIGHLMAIMGISASLYGQQQGYRKPGRISAALARFVTLEFMAGSGLLLIGAAGLALAAIFVDWTGRGYAPALSPLPAVGAVAALSIGIQNVFGAFLLAIVGGNKADFLSETVAGRAACDLQSEHGRRSAVGETCA